MVCFIVLVSAISDFLKKKKLAEILQVEERVDWFTMIKL